MANEPEREIEKLLKTAAKQRRNEAGEPRPLHPATRKMLLAEAARVHGRTSRAGVRGIFWGSWLRLAMSTSALAIVLLAAWILVPWSPREKESLQLAKNETNKKKEAPALRQMELERAPAAATPPPNQLADKLESDARSSGVPANQPALAPAAPAPEPKQFAQKPYAAGQSASADAKTDSLAAAAPRPAASVLSAESLTLAARDDVSFDTQRFKNEYAREANLGEKQLDREGSTVLSSFRLEETGNQVRIVDSDGSVYTGVVETPADATKDATTFATAKSLASNIPPESAARSEALKARRKDAETIGGTLVSGNITSSNTNFSLAATAPPAVVFFRVTGTNVSLHQEVNFIGRLLVNQATNAAVANAVSGKSGVGGEIAQPPARNSRVEGRAVIGRTNKIEIKAKAY